MRNITPERQFQISASSASIFPRTLNGLRNGILPPKQDSQNYSPEPKFAQTGFEMGYTSRKLPAYIPTKRLTTVPRRDTSGDPNDLQFSRASGEFDQENNWIRHEVHAEQPQYDNNPVNYNEYPHSYYPFSKTIRNEDMQANSAKFIPTATGSFKTRGKGPYYSRAMQELGGIEDKLADMEDSLKKNELKILEASQNQWNFKPWSTSFNQGNEDTLRLTDRKMRGTGRLVNTDTDRDYWRYTLEKDDLQILKGFNNGKPPLIKQ